MKEKGVMKWVIQYKCGCSDGPKRMKDMCNYCPIHGDDIQVKYPDLSLPIKKKIKDVDKEESK
jgi:hypothetical protein